MATRKPRTRPWTRADLERLPDDGNRYEVLNGELLVTPQAALAHQRIAFRIAKILDAHCTRYGIGIVASPGAVIFGKNELQPDVEVIPGTDHPAEARWQDVPHPILVVEVLSSSTRGRDFGKKATAYLSINTPEYWIVDGRARTISVLRPASQPVVVTDVMRWQPAGGGAELTFLLDEVFL